MAVVLGVADRHVGQRVGALLIATTEKDVGAQKKNDSQKPQYPKLFALERWLALERGLSAEKIPTLLPWASASNALPVIRTVKVRKAPALETFFSEADIDGGFVEMSDLP
ncbi:hypothetical protein BDV19DRAFT_385261 [Aspergillus venezuelensis]